MKRFFALILVMTMLFSLTACYGCHGPEENPPTERGTEAIEKPTGTTNKIPESTGDNNSNSTTQHTHSYVSEITEEATCAINGIRTYTCSCGDTYTEAIAAVGHVWTTATCTQPKTCSVCKEQTGTALEHTWIKATCTEAKRCSVCNETSGTALGHTWIDATCTEAKRCSVCNETSGTALGHTWIDATCTEAKHCSVCNETSGAISGHTWIDATCTEPKHCLTCNEQVGTVIDHIWVNATCTKAKHCLICDKYEGAALGHTWVDATCTKAKYCSVCQETSGSPIPHSYSNGKCTMCSKKDPNILTVNVMGLPASIYGYGTITDGSAYKYGDTIYLTLTIKRTGNLSGTIRWELFGGSYQYNKPGSAKAPSSESVGSTFTVTITITGVPEYSSYRLYVY